ncbi:aspartyl-phosphate phosphatase Spo0E family protein [Halobacillus rhizosphaerae]|uniref:Spo0E family sporulation regulatory protein-aspartic acid phosphatase n=1 Tax=Halobacillus rhizosphaerae TaxID=3064889 RepID=UPI00398B7DFE
MGLLVNKRNLEIEIEELRKTMYEAYKNSHSYEEILEISQRLDVLLNLLQRNKQ